MLKRFIILTLAIVMITGLSGCQLLHLGKNASAGNDTASADQGGGGGDGGNPQSLFNDEPQPLVKNYRPISVKMPDGINIVGDLYIPGISPYTAPADDGGDSGGDSGQGDNGTPSTPVKPAKIQYPLVVLLHMLSGNRWDWKDFPEKLVNSGYAVLVIDLRGHGDSVYRGKTLKVWREFDQNDWLKLADDPGFVLDYISKQKQFNMVNTHQLAFIGADIGANTAIEYAGNNPALVRAFVLLSPGLDYYGLKTFDSITHYDNAAYYIASQEDGYSSKSAERLYKYTVGKKKIQIYANMGHGTDILNNDPDLRQGIIDWLEQVFPPQKVPASVTQQPATPSTSTSAPAIPATSTNQSAGNSTPSPNNTSTTPASTQSKSTDNTNGKAKQKPGEQKAATKKADQKKTDQKTAKATPKATKPAVKKKMPKPVPVIDQSKPSSVPPNTSVTTPSSSTQGQATPSNNSQSPLPSPPAPITPSANNNGSLPVTSP